MVPLFTEILVEFTYTLQIGCVFITQPSKLVTESEYWLVDVGDTTAALPLNV
jgi:hypothetical protein